MSDMLIDKDAVVAVLNKILETELSGVVRYTHYALMVYGLWLWPDSHCFLDAWTGDGVTDPRQRSR